MADQSNAHWVEIRQEAKNGTELMRYCVAHEMYKLLKMDVAFEAGRAGVDSSDVLELILRMIVVDALKAGARQYEIIDIVRDQFALWKKEGN
jgi:hypothetical protein